MPSNPSSIDVMLNDISCTSTIVNYFLCDNSSVPTEDPTLAPTANPTTEEPTVDPSTVLLMKSGPFSAVNNDSIGTIDIYDEMHYEFEITLYEYPNDTLYKVVHCGNAGTARWPLIGVWDRSDNTSTAQFHIKYSSVTNMNEPYGVSVVGDPISLNTAYQIEIDVTQSWWWIHIDGVEVFNGSIDNHLLWTDQTCWLVPSWFDPNDTVANASVANILITNGIVFSFVLQPIFDVMHCDCIYSRNVLDESSEVTRTYAPSAAPTTSPTSPEGWVLHNDSTLLPREDRDMAVAYYNNSIYILYVLIVVCVSDQILSVHSENIVIFDDDQWRTSQSVSMDKI